MSENRHTYSPAHLKMAEVILSMTFTEVLTTVETFVNAEVVEGKSEDGRLYIAKALVAWAQDVSA